MHWHSSLCVGAGEAALADPEYIGYENLKAEPDFARYSAKGAQERPEEVQTQNVRELIVQLLTNGAGVRDTVI